MTVQRIDPRASGGTMVHLIERSKPKLAEVATRYLSEDRLCALGLSMWKKDRRIRECSPESFLFALYKACQYGLDPSGVGNQGHIVAYRGQAEFVRGWGGVITMAARRGITIDTFAVYESDEFEVARHVNATGYHLGLHHVEKRDGDLGNVRAAYAVASCKDWERPMIEVVWRHDIEKIRKGSASPSSPAWKAWYSEMARKTAVNRLAKRLPLFVDVKELDSANKARKVSIPISNIANEDTFYQGKVGDPTIDAPIDGEVIEEKDTTQLDMISEALQLRVEFPAEYAQVLGRKDVTKMGRNELTGAISKIREVGAIAETASTEELVAHEQSTQEEELGF